MKTLSTVVLLAAIALTTTAVWALVAGDPAPPLTLQPVNVDAEARNIIGDLDGTVVLAFINGTQIKGELTDELSDLIKGFNALHEANQEGVSAYMVVVGEYTEEQIKAWAEGNGLTVPTALKQPDDEELKAWELPGDAAAILYSISKDDSVARETKDPNDFKEVIQDAGQ